MKSAIYGSLGAINYATEQIAQHLAKLAECGIILPDFADLRTIALEEIRSHVNLNAVLKLAEIEMTDAAAFQKQRLEIEERFKSE